VKLDQHNTEEPERILRLSESADWCVLDEFNLTKVEKLASSRFYRFGESIFLEGDAVKGVYYVQSGLLGVRKADRNGNDTLIKIASEGDTLGYRPLIAAQPHRASAEALRDSIVRFLDKDTVLHLIEDSPALGLNFLKRAARELGDMEQRFHEQITLDTRTRFAHLMMVMKEKHGNIQPDGSMDLDLPLSRSDIAAMLGVRRESVSRAIRELEEARLAFFSARKVIVPNPALLQETMKK